MRWLWIAVLVGATAACMGGSEEEAMLRGDQAFARGDVTEALAEYRLALRQSGPDVDVLLRAAHSYARVGRIDEARQHYREAVELDPDVADLAAADLLQVARRAVDRRDGVGAAAAVGAAAELRPGVSLTGVALPLARHFAQNGQHGQALPFFEKAVHESESDPGVVFEMALAHEELGDCQRALYFFEQIYDAVPAAQRSEVMWHVGNCSADLAREAQESENWDEALEHYRMTIALGEPRNRVAVAWFETGEILALQGECTAAVNAFQRAEQDDLAGTALADRARSRVDDIRFRRGTDGPC